jgi:hypothetical protein
MNLSPLYVRAAAVLLTVSCNVFAQGVRINNVDCATGSVTFGGGFINVTATGACVTAAATPPTITSGAPPATANVGATYAAFQFQASGTTPITWSLASAGTLPPGLNLSSSGALSGTPTTAGAYTFSVVAANGTLPNANAGPFTITVSNAPVITSAPPPAAVVNTSYTHTFTASQTTPAITWGLASGSNPFPPGLDIVPTSGVFSGTPTMTGTYTFTVQATNTNGSGTQNVTLVVNATAPPPPTITSCSGTVGGAFSLVGTNLSGATLTIGGTSVTTPTVTATMITGNVPASITAANAAAPVVVTVGSQSTNGTCNIAAATGGLTSLEGFPIPNPSKVAKMAGPRHDGENGGGDGINAWLVASSRCGTPSPAIAKYWHHNIDFDDYASKVTSDNIYMGPNEAITYQFTGPTSGSYVGDIFLTQASGSYPATTFVSISETPCDFDVAKATAGNACYTSEPTENGFQFQVTSGTVAARCKIAPGVTYYLNVRFLDRRSPSVDTCAASGQPFCGVFLQIRKY